MNSLNTTNTIDSFNEIVSYTKLIQLGYLDIFSQDSLDLGSIRLYDNFPEVLKALSNFSVDLFFDLSNMHN